MKQSAGQKAPLVPQSFLNLLILNDWCFGVSPQ